MRAPMFMGIDMRKRVTVPLEAELHARAYDAARLRNGSNTDPKVGPFCAWCVRQVLTLEFLSAENREFLSGMLSELGAPWTTLDLLNVIVSTYRKQVRTGKLRPTFWTGQIKFSAKNGAK
jgi:hypothetical protein